MSDPRVLPVKDTAGTITFRVLVDSKEVPDTIEFLTIVTNREVNRIPSARLIIKDGSASSEKFEVSDQDVFIPGKKIEIQAGYDSKNMTLFTGIIIKHGIKIREKRSSVLQVDCRDEAVKMTVGRKSNYFEEMKDSEVLENIISQYGLKKSVSSTSLKHKELVQYYCTDWDFLVSRAEMNGMLVIVNDGEVKIEVPKTASSAKLSLIHGDTLYEFEAEIDARNQFKSVKSSSWESKSQKVIEKAGSPPAANAMGNLKEQTLADVIGLSDFRLKHSGKVIDQELQQWSDATLVKSQLSKVIGMAKIQGYPDLLTGDTVEFKGVGDRFNGKAYITGIRQEIVEGTWYTQIQFGLSPEWFYNTYEAVDRPASGLLPGINGLHIGIVRKLESDPDGEDRIQVVLPLIDENANGIWARLASLDAGNKRGWIFRPEIGDEVIVGFINEDPRDAVVLGMLHSQKMPAPVPPKDDNHEKGLVSRSEMRIWLDDEKKIMTLDTKAGNKIEISEDGKSITLEDQNGNKIVMDNSGIEINSPKDIKVIASGKIEATATQDCNVEGMNVGLKANAEFKAEGQAGAKVTTSAIAVLKGSMVQIN